MELFRRKPKPRVSTWRLFAIVPIPTEGPSRAVVWLEWFYLVYDRKKGGFARISARDRWFINPQTVDVDRPHKISST